jgi:hypothetical protein
MAFPTKKLDLGKNFLPLINLKKKNKKQKRV